MTIHQSIVRQQTVKLRVEDFDLLNRSGAFDDWTKVELIDGEIFGMNAQAMPHMRMKMALYDALRDALCELGLPHRVFTEATVAFPEHDAPEPDLLVIDRFEGDGFVLGSSVCLLAEVSDTTLTYDLGPKANLYARLHVPEYWVADVNARVLHQMWEPSLEGYCQRREIAFGGQVQSIAMPDIRFTLPDQA